MTTTPFSWNLKREVLINVPPRGGSTIIEVNSKIIIFGGADRNGQHFNDVIMKSKEDSQFYIIATHGDIPTPRSGHAVAGYGRYLFLFGGINFAEEADYNDLYILDTESLEWKYVGETGVEIKARNSHSLSILSIVNNGITSSYIVIFGGASSEVGPLGDTIYAKLPAVESVAMNDIYVEWKKVDGISPVAREMHSTSSFRDAMYIIGGRDEDGTMLSDVWRLTIESDALKWNKLSQLSLQQGRCSHTSTIICFNNAPYLCMFGGFTALGSIDDKILSVPLTTETDSWTEYPIASRIERRFGHSMCSLVKYPVDEAGPYPTSILIYGGVNADSDFNDINIIDII